jgi:hypothetical protein
MARNIFFLLNAKIAEHSSNIWIESSKHEAVRFLAEQWSFRPGFSSFMWAPPNERGIPFWSGPRRLTPSFLLILHSYVSYCTSFAASQA